MSKIEDIRLRKQLVDVAMGRIPASMVIRNGKWLCVQSGEILPATDIAIIEGRIAYVGPNANHTISKETQVIEAEERYLVPGLLDAHMHIESGMLTVTEFVRAVIPHGTTGMFVDPHEIANVFGLQGVRLMVDEAAIQPIHVWVQAPSCVPSAPGLETPGAAIGPEEVAEAMTWDGIIGLGEVMNFVGVYLNDEKMHAEMAEARLASKVIGGHYASPDLGLSFHGYVAAGAEDDHEGTRLEDALARVRQGMKAMLRLGSAWHDVDAQVKAITEMGLDGRHFILCTDDSHCETLVSEGHIDRAVRGAISQGLSPIQAIQMATINSAEHFKVSGEVGMIAPGRFADILLVKDLPQFSADLVIGKGVVLAKSGEMVTDLPAYPYPGWVKDSVHLKVPLTEADFRFRYRGSKPVLRAHVIGVIENQAPTRHLQMEVMVRDGDVVLEPADGLAKIALVERHHNTGRLQLGLVHGFGFDIPCAIASTVAHDCHHLIIVGNNEADMALAGNELARIGGGQIVVSQGKVIGKVNLPIAGLMSNERADIVAQKAASVLHGFRTCGCKLNNPNMQLSLLALVVIPALRISDKGLVDVEKFDFVPVFED